MTLNRLFFWTISITDVLYEKKCKYGLVIQGGQAEQGQTDQGQAVSPLSIIHNVISEITPNDSHRVAVLHLWPVVERVKFLKCTDQPPSKLSVVHHHLLLGEAHLGAQHHHVKHLIDSMNSY